ncbi:MAG TPA: S24 family peptidase [Gammaproteobacteria bacterium]|nr:S24 family peptidase [Gammaproteobacteria bacterium]
MAQAGCSADGMEPFALRVIGESMSPAFEDGHIIIVDPGHPLMSPCYAVLVNQGEVLFGRYLCDDGIPRLEYLHPDHPPVYLAADFQVKGVVTQRNTRRRRDTVFFDYPLSDV